MSPRTRILGLVAVAGAVAVGVTAAVAWSGSDDDRSGARTGAPPLALDLGVREDDEARALGQARGLYAEGRRAAAGRIFRRYASPAAQVGAAFASWPSGTVSRLAALAERHPDDALVLLNLGVARYWSGDDAGATAAWRRALEAEPDSPAAVTADWLLHPNTPQGAPVFVPSFPPAQPQGTPAEQLRTLQRAARKPDVRARLQYGVALQRLGRLRSAERAFASAAALDADAVEPQVAVAVSRFSRSDPARAFSRLGPLTERYEREPTVRFHLGLLLAWLGRVDEAEKQFARASRIRPADPLAQEAGRWLASLQRARADAEPRSSGEKDESGDP